MIGQSISHYNILEKLGEGGMGVVFKALDTRLNRFVALKFLPQHVTDDEEAKTRLVKEARAASAINHPNVCVIYDIEEAEGQQFISMEYVDGVTLREKFQETPIPLEEAVSYAIQIGDALLESHNKGIVHRDVKPDNIMVNAKNQIKVTDFGLARLKDAVLRSRTSSTVGTLAYMAPEQIQGSEVDQRADIFALGVVLYEMLTRRLPFHAAHRAAMMYSILHEEPEPLTRYLANAPKELLRILELALAKEPSDRYQSVRDMVDGLRRIGVASAPTSGRSLKDAGLSGLASMTAFLRNKRARRAIAGSAMFVLLAVLVLFVSRLGKPSGGPAEKALDSARIAQDGELPASTVGTVPARGGRPTASPPSVRQSPQSGSAPKMHNELTSAPEPEVVAPGTAGQPLPLNVEREKNGRRIAVLPFSNISPEEKDAYFSDGMTEELISTLSRIQGLRVIARTSMMQYKGTSKNVAQIGSELRVNAILEGSVRKSGNKLRITVKLIDVASQEPLWSEEYDRELTDVFMIQANVAQRVAEALQVKLLTEEKSQIGKSGTGNTEAFTLYLQGRFAWSKRSPPELLQSVEYFKKAVQRDPRYAAAYAGLADAYTLLGNYYVLPPADAYVKAKASALKALEIDESLAEAHTSLAFALMHYDWNWREAEAEFRKAIELNPSLAVAHIWYAYFLTMTGRFDEAVAVRDRAQELDPLSVVISSDAGLTLYFGRKYDETIEQFHRMLKSDPTFYAAYIPLGGALLHRGRVGEAISSFKKAKVFSQNHPIASAALAYAYAVTGKGAEARKIAGELEKLYKTSYVSPYWIAVIHVGLGERDKAFEWLDKGVENHDGSMIFLKVEPILDSLRSDVRFVSLLTKIGLNN